MACIYDNITRSESTTCGECGELISWRSSEE